MLLGSLSIHAGSEIRLKSILPSVLPPLNTPLPRAHGQLYLPFQTALLNFFFMQTNLPLFTSRRAFRPADWITPIRTPASTSFILCDFRTSYHFPPPRDPRDPLETCLAFLGHSASTDVIPGATNTPRPTSLRRRVLRLYNPNPSVSVGYLLFFLSPP